MSRLDRARSELRRQLGPLQWMAIAWVLVFSLAIAFVFYKVTIAQQRQTEALCAQWKRQATAPIVKTAGPLTRSTVQVAAANYSLISCEDHTGPLGQVDPAAYEPAPTP